MSKFKLKNMEFHAHHGCLEHEQKLGNTFIVNIIFEFNTQKAGFSDELVDTLNYQLIYNIIKDQMEIPSKLIEHIGQRIMDKIISTFPQIQSLELTLSKLNPPLGGKVESVSIVLEQKNNMTDVF